MAKGCLHPRQVLSRSGRSTASERARPSPTGQPRAAVAQMHRPAGSVGALGGHEGPVVTTGPSPHARILRDSRTATASPRGCTARARHACPGAHPDARLKVAGPVAKHQSAWMRGSASSPLARVLYRADDPASNYRRGLRVWRGHRSTAVLRHYRGGCRHGPGSGLGLMTDCLTRAGTLRGRTRPDSAGESGAGSSRGSSIRPPISETKRGGSGAFIAGSPSPIPSPYAVDDGAIRGADTAASRRPSGTGPAGAGRPAAAQAPPWSP